MIEFLVVITLLLSGAKAAEKVVLSEDLNLVHPYVEPFYESFEEVFKVKISGIGAGFYVSHKFGTKMAVCHNYGISQQIRIDYEKWLYLTYYDKEQLIWHELAHCMFGIDHDTSIAKHRFRWITASIMYPYMIPTDMYVFNRSYYIKELKQQIEERKPRYKTEGIQ